MWTADTFLQDWATLMGASEFTSETEGWGGGKL